MRLEVSTPIGAELLGNQPDAGRWTLAIEFLKDRVDATRGPAGTGKRILENDVFENDVLENDVFENDAVRLAVSPEGFYVEFAASPGTFYGAMREVKVETVGDDEALILLWDAISLYRSGHGRVMVVYGPDYRERDDQVFVGCYAGLDPVERGFPRVEPPLFFRADVESAEPGGLVDGQRGTVLMVRGRDGRSRIVRVPEGPRLSGVMIGVRE